MHPILIRSYKVTQRSCTRGGHAQPRARLSGTLFSPPWAWGVARCTCTYRVVPYGCRRIKTSLVSRRFRRWLSLCETSGHFLVVRALSCWHCCCPLAGSGWHSGGAMACSGRVCLLAIFSASAASSIASTLSFDSELERHRAGMSIMGRGWCGGRR